jgi:hypothetical protein
MTTEYQTGVIKPIECFKEAWASVKPDYWFLFAITLVGMLIGGVTLYILLGAMMCGINICFLKRIDGSPVALDDLWKGMKYLLPGLVVTLLIMVPVMIVMVTMYVPMVLAAVMGERMSQDELLTMMAGMFGVEIVFAVVMVCIHALLVFSFPLMVDRNLGPVKAMTTSARAVLKNLGGVVGLMLVAMVAGTPIALLTCGLGMYAMMPLIIGANVVAYRKIFPRLQEPRFDPPPPSLYQQL